MKLKRIITLFLALFAVASVSALELKIDDEILVESKQYNEDYMFSGSKLVFNGEANDLYAFVEEKVDFKGRTKLAIFAAGEEIEVAGVVGNGVKGAGQFITLNGEINGTSFLAGEHITFTGDSTTNGTSFVAAQSIQVRGPIMGDFYGAAGDVSIQNEISGDVHIYTGQLNITEQGKINGDLIYHSDHEISEEEAARVAGSITYNIDEENFFTEDDFDGWPWFPLIFKLSFAIIGFLILLFPVTKTLEKPLTEKSLLSYSLWGLIPIFIYPTMIVFSIVLVITIPLGIALLLGLMPLLFVTKIIGITLIGGLISRRLNLTSNSRYFFFLIGIVLYSILSFIPYIGALLMILVIATGCGTLLSSLIQKDFE
ncbi:MAG: hypothetical protein GY786_01980 [Proteobacteria bacterium]|nr:hypothetical protein [Pseudomonadota bacterium]